MLPYTLQVSSPYLPVQEHAFRREYRAKGILFVLVFLLGQKVGNQTRRSEPFLACADHVVGFIPEIGSCLGLRGRILEEFEDKCTQ